MAISSSNPPPLPQHSGGKVLLVCGVLVAMLLAAAVFSIYFGVRIISRSVVVHSGQGAHGAGQVAIDTPLGSVRVSHGTVVDTGLIGLPLYPGARQLKDVGSNSVAAQFGNENQLGVMAAKFETSDPIEKVAEFYRQRLRGQITRFIQRDASGQTLFEIKTSDEDKIVTLKHTGDETRIALVKLFHGNHAAN